MRSTEAEPLPTVLRFAAADTIKEAVDLACAASGRDHPTLVSNPCKGPDRSLPNDCCPACAVWHRLNGRIG